MPILVGAISTAKETRFGEILAPFLADPENFFVVSSDFCHWYVEATCASALTHSLTRCCQCSPVRRPSHPSLTLRTTLPCRGSRFSYTFYRPSPDGPSTSLTSRSSSSALDPRTPIHLSIRHLDNEGMQAISFHRAGGSDGKTAKQAKDEFAAYLKRTKNTVCGRHPIGVLLGALACLEAQKGTQAECRFVRYEVRAYRRARQGDRPIVLEETAADIRYLFHVCPCAYTPTSTPPQQSSECETPRDSSVSYASAFARFSTAGQ